ncbi:MAG: class I SAM-dependent methyltransferase [Elusimicrobiota bacterium]
MKPLYDAIGATYRATRRADPAITRDLARLIVLKDGSRFLDVACGTGNYTRALAALGGRWHGIDVSETMILQAQENAAIDWRQAAADALPFEDASFDGLVCTLAIHHFSELLSPFREAHRVLDKGRFVIFTSFPEQMRAYWLCRYFPQMMRRSIEKMPSRETLLSTLRTAGFEIDSVIPYRVTSRLQDLFLYAGKERPELYLDPAVRANISSFASLCEPAELHEGLRALRADLDSGRFQERRRPPSKGDYAFVVAFKQ